MALPFGSCLLKTKSLMRFTAQSLRWVDSLKFPSQVPSSPARPSTAKFSRGGSFESGKGSTTVAGYFIREVAVAERVGALGRGVMLHGAVDEPAALA